MSTRKIEGYSTFVPLCSGKVLVSLVIVIEIDTLQGSSHSRKRISCVKQIVVRQLEFWDEFL